MATNTSTDPRNAKWKRRSEIVAVVLLGLATMGSSWAAYQASLWGGIQTFRLADASARGRESAAARDQATQVRSFDASFFVEYLGALAQGRTRLAQAYHDRMRPEARAAVDAWLRTRPFAHPEAVTSPFGMPEYKLVLDRQVQELAAKADEMHKTANRANFVSDSYTLLTVFYSAVLFLAGLTSNFSEIRIRWVLLIPAGLLLVFATIRLAGLPAAKPG
jgi:hypothetical protein